MDYEEIADALQWMADDIRGVHVDSLDERDMDGFLQPYNFYLLFVNLEWSAKDTEEFLVRVLQHVRANKHEFV